ncbi:hypothetical protein KFL_010110060 [Klebsormidium nitens]|uniref:Retroviral polymerase SH3-like domain-containing protein n=1 Tax=Klebsormidium nitens TaxID=105231 RepID=A0A1Y1INF7_KLENI|nr:hypothetical protein KFL_010110060 [Klebsormidium nitens]|eukprot:GAQ92420.1 hypothetical protein KFL_010110060 [Klebsormidium nitens]
MRVFGARAYRHVPKQRRRKLDPVSERFVFVGYEPDSKAYPVLRESDGRIMNSGDVIFDEGEGDNGVVELSSNPGGFPGGGRRARHRARDRARTRACAQFAAVSHARLPKPTKLYTSQLVAKGYLQKQGVDFETRSTPG